MKSKAFNFAVLLVVGSVAASGCAEEDGSDAEEIDLRVTEIVDNLMAAGYSEDDIEIREPEARPGVDTLTSLKGEPLVVVQNDVIVTLEASRELAGLTEDGDEQEGFRQWRTPGLVNANEDICLIRITSVHSSWAGYALSSKMQTGVSFANDNLAALSINLDFTMKNGSIDSGGFFVWDDSGCDSEIFIYRNPNQSGAGGIAGFPSGGDPYSQVQMYAGLDDSTWDTQETEHVATHEIGHSIGLRHSDWKTRESCGSTNPEDQDGASLIGSTEDTTTNSVMKACFNNLENGEFKGDDEEALETIY